MKRLYNGAAAWLIFAALATSAFWMLLGPPDAGAQSGGFTNFDSVVVDQDILVGDDGTFGGSLSVSGVIAASSYLTAAGDLTTPGALTVTGNAKINGTSVLVGNLSDSNSALTIADNALVDGAADAIQLTVQGNATNTNPLFVVENSAGTDQFVVSNVGNMTTTADAAIGDDLVVTDDATTNDLFVSAWTRIVPRTGVVVTMNGIITPTGTYQPLSSAGTVNTAQIAAGTAGDLLILVNTAATTIVISDTSPLILSGNISLGQYDTLTLRSDGTRWIQLTTSNN